MRRTALVIRVPEAESAVGGWCARLASDAVLGVPAHITVLFPFVASDEFDHDVRARLASALGSLAAFEFALVRTAWFGDDVLWLAPDDDRRIRTVISAAERAFPTLRPYGGAYDETIPHLTVGDRKPHSELVTAENDVTANLPIRCRVETVTLLEEQGDGKWQAAEEFPLGS